MKYDGCFFGTDRYHDLYKTLLLQVKGIIDICATWPTTTFTLVHTVMSVHQW